MPNPRFINPDTLAPPPGYTQVVEVSGPGRTVYIAGQIGLDIEGKLVGAPGDFRAQAEKTFKNLQAALASVGAGFEHIVKVNNYLIDMAHLPILREVRSRYIGKVDPPASTTVAISALALEGALYEVDAVAVLPE